MRIIVSGTMYTLADLTPEIDRAFLDLYSAWMGNSALMEKDFRAKGHVFFDSNPTEDKQGKFFDNFTIIWTAYLNNRSFHLAEEVWEFAINIARSWEDKNPGRFIHKGTPYYFWGMTAIENGDIDKGYALMHQALEEDARYSTEDFPQTPASYLVTLNYEPERQAYRKWLMEQTTYLNTYLNSYQAKHKSSLTLDEFRKRFLLHPPSRHLAFLFAYTVARLYRIDKIPHFARNNSFSGQVELNMLFDLTLVIEGAIKKKNAEANKFIDHAAFLNQKRNVGLTKEELGIVNGKLNDDFDDALAKLLSGKMALSSNGKPMSQLPCDLAIAYGIRNRGAHDMQPIKVLSKNYVEVRQSVLNVLFWLVEDLY